MGDIRRIIFERTSDDRNGQEGKPYCVFQELNQRPCMMVDVEELVHFAYSEQARVIADRHEEFPVDPVRQSHCYTVRIRPAVSSQRTYNRNG